MPPAITTPDISIPKVQPRLRPRGAGTTNVPAAVAQSQLQSSFVAPVLGTKRRHVAMSHESCAPKTASIDIPCDLSPSLTDDDPNDSSYTIMSGMDAVTQLPVARRRMRNLRTIRDGLLTPSPSDSQFLVGDVGDTMSVENDDERERKRVARR